jgi:nucleotide-binding universal stress UspA family protein
MATIVHPTNFSETSRTAFENALCLAFVGQHKLVLLHVNSRKIEKPNWAEFPHIRETLAGWGFISKNSPVADLYKETGLLVQKVNAVGSDPATAVIDYLGSHGADLIVVGTQGRDGWEAWLNRSVAMKLADGLTQPVLFVRDGVGGLVGESPKHSQVRVLVPVDNEPDPQMAVDSAFMLKEKWNVPVGIISTLHVGEKPLRLPIGFPKSDEIDFQSHRVTGIAEEKILEICEEQDMDIIVMTRAGPDKLSERMVGSTTEQVIRTAPCPVLIVRAGNYGT